MKNTKGITLVALVITIIILIILASVTMVTLLSEDGIISRAKEAGYKTNFSEVQEKTMLYWTKEQQDDIMNGQSRTVSQKLPLGSQVNLTSPKNDTLIAEIKEVRGNTNLDISSLELYEINKSMIESNVPHKYIIDLATLEIYDYDGENFRGKWHHTLRGLGVEGGTGGEVEQGEINTPASVGKEITWVDDIGWIKPDINGFNLDFTWMVYYNSDFTVTYDMPIKEYIEKGRPNTTTVGGVTYTLDDYVHKAWANVKTKANGIESWWVWIPRYVYILDDTNQEADIIYVDLDNTQLRRNGNENANFANYTLHPAFTETWTEGGVDKTKALQGIWMSKYEASNISNSDETRIASSGSCYPPNLDGFDRNTTYIEYYNKNTDSFTSEKLIKDVNLETEKNNKNWFDYSNKVWANIKTTANGMEAWWVWIPRFAYIMSNGNEEVEVIFIDLDDKPYDKAIYGNKPVTETGWTVHPAFNEKEDGTIVKKLDGIWMSKFEKSNSPNSDNIATSGECYEPELTGFDKTENGVEQNTTYVVYWNEDFSDKKEVLLKDYISGNKQRTITYGGETYTFYDYRNKVWANIVTRANGIEAWWVWIPRFAYVLDNADEETNLIFVDLNDTPYDKTAYGNSLKAGMVVHPAFNEQYQEEQGENWVTRPVLDENNNPKKLKGIWVSKYEASLPD